MRQLPNIELNLWNAGVWLTAADLAFAPSEARQKWQELSKRSAIQEGFEKLQSRTGEIKGFAEGLQTFADGTQDVLSARTAILNRAREQLVGRLCNKKVLGLGFEKPRRVGSVPHRIDAGLWHGRVLWDKNALESQGLHFVEIRILSPSKVAQIEKAVLKVEGFKELDQPITKGRPTIRPQIDASYQKLCQTNLPPHDIRIIELVELVRRQMRLDSPDMVVTASYPNSETIRRIVSPLWKSRNNKQ